MKNEDELVFLPLGGCGEIGMNLNLYGFGSKHNRKWIIVDLGVTFGGYDTPGVEIIMPDIEFIKSIKKDILGIVLTHAHEDHMGAVARLWPFIKAPVYATPFTMYLVEDRLAEAGLLGEVALFNIPLKGKFVLGDFDIELVTLTHSIPEPNALIIRTPAGTVLHTGDWKIDEAPQIGETVDVKALSALGEEGVLAMICDSTNVLSPGRAGSEAGVRDELAKLIGEYKEAGIAVSAFASNVARLESIMLAAKQNGRKICLLGRSMFRMVAAAKSVGLLKNIGTIIEADEAAFLPKSEVLYLCTGSQGEPRAALARIAKGEHKSLKLGEGDVVIFSSKIIPGNEKTIFALHNNLADKGVEIITEKDRAIHVSGHPYRDELKDMYNWVRPKIAIPVHGERRHLLEHARLAKSLQVPFAIAPHNGEMIKLSDEGAEITDIVPAGRLYEDAGEIINAEDLSMRERKKMAYAGHIAIAVVIDNRGELIGGPDPRISGFPFGENGRLIDNLLDEVADCAEAAFFTLSRQERKDEDTVEARINAKVRRMVRDKTDKRAIIETIAIRV